MRIWTVKSKKCFYENLIQLTDIDYSQSKQLSNKNDLINLQRIRTIIHDHEISFVSVVIRNEQNYMQICTWFAHYQLHRLHFIFLQCGKENNNAISALESKYCTQVCVFYLNFFTCSLISHPFHVLWSSSLHVVQNPYGFDGIVTINHSPFHDHVIFFPAGQRWVLDFYAVQIHIAIVL